MATLHTLNKPPSYSELCAQLTNAIQEGDSVLLIEDGVYHALEPQRQSGWQTKAKTLFILKEDAQSRGIEETSSIASYISFEQFVELSTTHSKVVSWY